MAKKTKFTFTHDDGRVSTRSSEGRTYTHVVLTRVDVVKARAECDTPAWRKHDGKDWDYFVSPEAKGHYDKIVAEHGTKEAYVAARAASRLAWVNKNHGEGDVGREHVAQWSMSEANARKARPAGNYASIRVAPVDPQPVKQTAEAAPAAPAADAGEWVPVSADEAATIAATEAAACAAAGPTALHALVADKAPAPAWPNRLFDQLSDPEVEAVAALVGVDQVGPSFRNYLRDTPALTGDDWTVGDAARAYLNTRLTYLTRDSVARHASDLIDQEREAARQ